VSWEPDDLHGEIAALRQRAEAIADELAARVRRRFDVRTQLREHRSAALLMGAALFFGVSGAVAFGVRRARAERRLSVRARRKIAAWAELLGNPERAAPRFSREAPRITGAKLLEIAVATAATALARSLARGLFARRVQT
jgi:hypothetical protein